MMRTLTNVNDSMLAGVVSSRNIGEFDSSVLNDDAAVVDGDAI
jgi:L-cystine uptake protein TcyP (sodium:dicarboxylate symporter family)